MRPYFEKMNDLGSPTSDQQMRRTEENIKQIEEIEKLIAEAAEKAKKAGLPTEEINELPRSRAAGHRIL